jgi:HK97 family phage prohead protease
VSKLVWQSVEKFRKHESEPDYSATYRQPSNQAVNICLGKDCVAEVDTETKAEDAAERVLQFTISTGAVDRENDTLDVNGWKLDEFEKSGVVLWAHDRANPPIAKPLKVWVEGDALKARAQFPDRDTHKFGALIYRLLKGGYVRGVSVGFRPIEWSYNEDRGPYAIDFHRQELVEFSPVPVAANPEAMIEAGKSLDDIELLTDWAASSLDGEALPAMPRACIETMCKALTTGYESRGADDDEPATEPEPASDAEPDDSTETFFKQLESLADAVEDGLELAELDLEQLTRAADLLDRILAEPPSRAPDTIDDDDDDWSDWCFDDVFDDDDDKPEAKAEPDFPADDDEDMLDIELDELKEVLADVVGQAFHDQVVRPLTGRLD